MRATRIPAHIFEEFVKRFRDPLISDLGGYLRWMHRMSILKTFWCSDWKSLGYLGLMNSGKLIGALRALRMRVIFHGHGAWRGLRERGEIQDIFLLRWRIEYLREIFQRAEKIFSRHGLKDFGISEWKPDAWRVLEECGFSPYARSVLITWNLREEIPKSGNQEVVIKIGSRRDLRKLRRIQRESWGFFIRPSFKHHIILIAYLGEEAVGSAYLNKYTGNIDFGVHVRRRFQRRRIGAAILHSARNLFRKLGFRRMSVVRVLRALSKVNESDRIALSFYINCGGRVLREYRGFRRKIRSRKLKIPNLSEYIA